MSYRISKLFSGSRTNCCYLSPPENAPHHEGAAHRHNIPYQPNATGTTRIDPTRLPGPNASKGRTSRPSGGADDGVPTTVLPTTIAITRADSPKMGTPRNTIPDGKQVTKGQLQRPDVAGRAHMGHHHARGTARSQHIHRNGPAGCRNPQNKPGRQPNRRLTTSERATQPATDQTAAEQLTDNEQTTRQPANTQPARHASVETGTTSHGLATKACATPSDYHTHEHSRTTQLYHYKPDQPTLTNYTNLHLDKPRCN